MSSETETKMMKVLNKVVKWRSWFASWQTGTRPDTDPECAAIKDHREVSILLRIEFNAMLGLLIKNGYFSLEEFQRQAIKEAELLDEKYMKSYPGVRSTEYGISFDIPEAATTMRRMNFKL